MGESRQRGAFFEYALLVAVGMTVAALRFAAARIGPVLPRIDFTDERPKIVSLGVLAGGALLVRFVLPRVFGYTRAKRNGARDGTRLGEETSVVRVTQGEFGITLIAMLIASATLTGVILIGFSKPIGFRWGMLTPGISWWGALHATVLAVTSCCALLALGSASRMIIGMVGSYHANGTNALAVPAAICANTAKYLSEISAVLAVGAGILRAAVLLHSSYRLIDVLSGVATACTLYGVGVCGIAGTSDYTDSGPLRPVWGFGILRLPGCSQLRSRIIREQWPWLADRYA